MVDPVMAIRFRRATMRPARPNDSRGARLSVPELEFDPEVRGAQEGDRQLQVVLDGELTRTVAPTRVTF
jgi:hypothetical protein